MSAPVLRGPSPLARLDGWPAMLALALMVALPLLEIVLRPITGRGVENASVLVQHLGLLMTMFGALAAERHGHLTTLGATFDRVAGARGKVWVTAFAQAVSALVCGMLLVMPFILYQLVALIMAVRGKSRRGSFLLIAAVCLLFLLGLAFAYFVVFPFAMNFFLGFASADVAAEWSIARYLSFATSFLLAFGLIFQLPLLFWFLGSMGLINAAFLRRQRRFAILIIFIAEIIENEIC